MTVLQVFDLTPFLVFRDKAQEHRGALVSFLWQLCHLWHV
jgi:hypothetical protein